MSGLVTSGRQKYRRVLIVVDSGRFISGNIEHNLFSNGNGINYVSYYSSFVCFSSLKRLLLLVFWRVFFISFWMN
jgi:hypothetical protein